MMHKPIPQEDLDSIREALKEDHAKAWPAQDTMILLDAYENALEELRTNSAKMMFVEHALKKLQEVMDLATEEAHHDQS